MNVVSRLKISRIIKYTNLCFAKHIMKSWSEFYNRPFKMKIQIFQMNLIKLLWNWIPSSEMIFIKGTLNLINFLDKI
jgi:hypothetical protein